MIFTERTVRIVNGLCDIDNPIILYRGDFNVEIRFTIIDCPYKYTAKDASNVIETTNASYGQLVIKTPNGDPIFSDVTATNEGAVVFTITGDMIDEAIELGEYDFQIRLFDSERTSRATICPVVSGIKVEEPIAIEGGSTVISDTNEVNVARANYAATTTATALEAFDSQGNYIETTWSDKMLITDARLNKIEDGITGVNQKIAEASLGGGSGSVDLTDYAKKTDIPTRVSQLTNDANYVNTTQMNEAIANVTGQTVEPSELDMPKVFFYGDALPTTKDNVNLTMDYVSNTTKFSSYIKLKCQGTSSMSYAKKNFTIAMYSDEARETKLKKDFKGWGDQSKFCLKANYVDTTHTRNLSGARIGYDMVASRPDSAFKQQLLTAPRYGVVDGFPIKLYFNGEFYGIYTWNIPKDAWMFNMDESNPNHCVLCAENNNNGNSSVTNSCQFRKAWNGSSEWSVEVGTASDNIKASFDRCINFVMTATDDEFKANIGEYFDLYSLLDYYCFSYLTCHLDGLAKNMLMATYDGVIWGASLYDMDSIYGVYYNGASYVATNYQCPEQYQETNSLLWQRIEACFGAELYARYLELRQGALSLSNIIKHVEEIYDVIPDRVFKDERAKWTSLPQVSTNTMTRFRNYMRDRAVYVDAQMLEIGARVACTGITLSANTLSFTTTDTQTITVTVEPTNTTEEIIWSASPTGIVTIENGVITPVANGDCTITVTCGSKTATCNVNVSLPAIECTSITLDKTELNIDVASDNKSYQLTATLEPSNTTYAPVWSVEPEGIVELVDGLVTPVANGNAVITVTCGSKTATCNVTVSGFVTMSFDDNYAAGDAMPLNLSKLSYSNASWLANDNYYAYQSYPQNTMYVIFDDSITNTGDFKSYSSDYTVYNHTSEFENFKADTSNCSIGINAKSAVNSCAIFLRINKTESNSGTAKQYCIDNNIVLNLPTKSTIQSAFLNSDYITNMYYDKSKNILVEYTYPNTEISSNAISTFFERISNSKSTYAGYQDQTTEVYAMEISASGDNTKIAMCIPKSRINDPSSDITIKQYLDSAKIKVWFLPN